MSIPNSKIFSIIFGRAQFVNGSDCKSRSRRRMDCDHRGLGRSTNKHQKPAESQKAKSQVLCVWVQRRIACG